MLKAVKVFRKHPTSIALVGPLLSRRVKEEPKLLQVVRRLQDHHTHFHLLKSKDFKIRHFKMCNALEKENNTSKETRTETGKIYP